MRLPFNTRALKLKFKSHIRAKSPPKAETQKLISPWVWAVFIVSLALFIATVFVTSWSSTGPTFFSPQLFVPKPPLPGEQLNHTNLARTLPSFLQLPVDETEILIPTIAATCLCVLLRFIPPTNTTRLIIKTIFLLLGTRYFIWRTLATLNFSHWISTALNLFMYCNEALCLLSCFLFTMTTVWTNDHKRSAEANKYSQDVLSGRYLPTVDVFIPTYNEPDYIVRRTAIGCQAIEYPNKTVYILDDTRRPHIQALAQELGCEYITRPDNKHAKAGNLNNALRHTKGELIALMDADFVPFNNFLTRTVGFFQKQHISLVQSKQNFYNPDYHARNLGLEHLLPGDLECFYGHIQSSRDVGNSVICCGTSYVVRRKHLEAVGGYYTRCCVEDFQTSMLMLTRGFRLLFLNETLSMGESTRTYADFIDQRLRWLQGVLQVYYCTDDIPMWTKLNLVQRLYALSQLFCCLISIYHVIFLIIPIVGVYLGVTPYKATFSEVIYYFLPFMLLNMTIGGWSSGYRTSFFQSQVYETILCFPAVQRIWLVFRSPFAKASRVTRKGVKAEKKNFNLHYTWHLLVLIALSIAIICVRLVGYSTGTWLSLPEDTAITFFWLIHNVIIMGVAVLSAIDQPVRRVCDRFPLRTTCKLTTTAGTAYWGYTNNLSEGGAYITLTSDELPTKDELVTIEFLEHNFSIPAKILRTNFQKHHHYVAIKFTQLDLEQSRHLVTLLYTQMNWWKYSKKAGGTDSLLAMLLAFLKLRPALTKYDR